PVAATNTPPTGCPAAVTVPLNVDANAAGAEARPASRTSTETAPSETERHRKRPRPTPPLTHKHLMTREHHRNTPHAHPRRTPVPVRQARTRMDAPVRRSKPGFGAVASNLLCHHRNLRRTLSAVKAACGACPMNGPALFAGLWGVGLQPV